MRKPFSNFLKKKKDKNKSLSKENDKNIKTEQSKPLIIIGFIVSLTSIFLLLFTINNKFG